MAIRLNNQAKVAELVQSLPKALNQLENDLNAAKDLVEVTMDKDAMQLIRAWYGSATSDSLIARACYEL